MSLKLIKTYIAKKFIVSFCQIVLGFSLLIFFVNLLESLENLKDSDAPFYIAPFMAFLNIGDFLNDIISSIVIIASITTFLSLSIKSEITIMRVSGYSLWQILQPVMISAFCLGVFWITIFAPISSQMAKKFNSLDNIYVKKETREVLEPKNGIWLRQQNIGNENEEIIIQAKKVYSQNLEFKDVTVWFFDADNKFYKKIDSNKMTLNEEGVLNNFSLLNFKLESAEIPTNFNEEFVRQRILNDFQNVKLFTVFQLPSLIKDLKSSGFNTNKFKVYFHSLLSKPFLFMAITLIACFFGLNHIRNQNIAIMTFLGVIVGLVFYIISSIMIAFGASGLIPIFASTWLIVLICFAIGILLIYQKESL